MDWQLMAAIYKLASLSYPGGHKILFCLQQLKIILNK